MERKPLVNFWQTGSGIKRHECGKKLEQLLSDGKTLEEAMQEVGLKTKSAALEAIRFYRYAVEHSVQADAATPSQAGAVCPHCGLPIMLVAPETPRR